MSLYKSPRSDCWYISISHGGKRIRCSTGTADKKQAQEYHDQFKAKLWRQERLGEQYTTFAVAALKWEKERPRGRTDLNILDNLREEIGDDTDLREITGGSLPAGIIAKSESTRRRYINTLSAICRLSGHDPKIKRPAPKQGRIRWLTKQEWKRLREQLLSIAPHLMPIADFAISTGLRMSNILTLEWSQCDLSRNLVWVHPDQSKSGKPISVPLSKDALRVLKKQRGLSEQFVFPYYDTGKPITRVSNHGWKSACKSAGLGDITFHCLRHTWATWHLQASPPTPLEVLQRLGGWSSLDMVMRYAHLGESHVAEYANNAKPKG